MEPARAQETASRRSIGRASPSEGPIRTRTQGIESDELPVEDRKFDKEQLKRLRVTWEKPRRTVDEEGIRRRPILEITGKLSLLQADGKTLKPVDWPYPIQVVIARRPNEKLDWSRWHDETDSVSDNTLVGHEFTRGPGLFRRTVAGVFTTRLKLSEIHGPIGATKPYQVGLCFGEKKGKKLTWCNEAPILPQSVKMLDVAGPRPISRTLQFINACPAPLDGNFDPIALVRAANHLQSLGKDKAIAALREFLKLAYYDHAFRYCIDPENIDTSNQYCLASLVPLVFDGVPQRERIRVFEGIPFKTVGMVSIRGYGPGSTRPLVEAAAKHGKLRKKPLRPTDNPLEAADTLSGKMADRELRPNLRGQAWRAIRHLVDPDSKRPPRLSSRAEWDKLKAKAAQLKIRWDEVRQEYVAGEERK
jgi:hypothetical protein